ncbi:MAG: hypothetical protein KBG04_05275 [Bacteroidales bacterium]|nr:hypothetical protein [Bacteroidales bacterium]
MSGSGANSTYTYQKSGLSVGTHNFYFVFSDGVNTVNLPPSGNYSGPTVSAVSLHDLTVDTLYFDPATPTPGGSITFYLTVRNQGPAEVTFDYQNYIYIDGVLSVTWTDDTRLAAGNFQGWYLNTTWP